jgi:phage replication-related protein YjqB (UPF0714/DUF867 family)
MTEYASMKELKDNETEHVDWRQSHQERDSWLVVVAPHGRTIEPLTELIAREIASDQFSFFVFEGLRRKDPERKPKWLHVRSELYKDDDLDRLQKKSKVTLSVHGAANKEELPERVTHMGGLNEPLRDLIWNALDGSGFSVVLGTGHLAGRDPNNFVNRITKGVQLEVSRSERDALADNPVRRARYIAAIREALLAYQAQLYAGEESAK